MSEAKFTKGNWEIDSKYTTFLCVASPSGCVCDVTCSMDGYNIAPTTIEKANAHLIAAAPEMYTMLESLREDYGLLTAVGKDIDNLLAKARGE